jgi:hypothetical protein
MNAWRRWSMAIALLFSLSLFAQDKGDDKKVDAKGNAEKKDEKKPESKDDKKPAEKANKYQHVSTVTGTFVRSDTEEMLIEVEVPVREGRSMHNKKETFTFVSDAKVRTIKLPERLDDNKKPIPYTPQEKAKLKGDNPKLPGYNSELSALKAGQIVDLDLSTHKSAAGAAKKKPEDQEKPFVTMIVIKEEPPKMIEKKKK